MFCGSGICVGRKGLKWTIFRIFWVNDYLQMQRTGLGDPGGPFQP